MESTTAQAVRLDFIDQIRQIVPAHGIDRAGWKPVDVQGDVPGTKLRLFYVMFDFGQPVEDDAIIGHGFTWETTVQVWTNYAGLADHEIDGVIPADGRQLYLTLEARLDPELTGLISVDYTGFTPEDDQPGHVWGYHSLTVRYLVGDV